VTLQQRISFTVEELSTSLWQ